MKKIITLATIILITIISCKDHSEDLDPVVDSSHLKYFGFTLVDTYWDDPTDNEAKTNYADEVHSFSNMADILIAFPSQDIKPNLDVFQSYELKAVLHLNEIFFEKVDTGGPSGAKYDLRANYKARWDSVMTTNDLIENQNKLQALYIGEEPTWNDISASEFKSACDYAKQTLPDVPILTVEAYPVLDEMEIPSSVDWVGFDRYFIEDPQNNPVFLKDVATLKSKINGEQKLVFIMDTHYIDWAHTDFGGITKEELKGVATSYYELAKSEEKAIGILGYFWPNGFDIEGSLGARGLPQSVKDEYVRIGKEISGK